MDKHGPSRLVRSLTTAGRILLAALAVTLLRTGSARAQEGRLRFERLTVADGLSQNTVQAVLQDRLGFMWFGTEEGLNKFDGYSFRQYQHDLDDPQSLSSNSVYTLFEDSRGRLWVGTSAGLDRFERETETFTHYDGAPANPLGSVKALAEDGQGRLWVGSGETGLWILEGDSGIFTRFLNQQDGPDLPGRDSEAADRIYEILRDRSGGMWIATDAGLEYFDPATGSFRRYQHDFSDPNSPSSSRVRALLEDRSGDLWIGTEGGGLNRFNPPTGTFTFYMQSHIDRNSLGDNRVVDLLEDSQGFLWVATPLGLDRLDPKTGQISHYSYDPKDERSLGSSQILSLYEDRSGVVWIGTRGAGLSQYKRSAHKFDLYQTAPLSPGGLSGSSILSILVDRAGDLWVGTAEAGLNRLERETGEWMVYRHDPSDPNSLGHNTISALLQSRDGSLWIGTSGRGLDRLDPNTGAFTHYRYIYGDPGSLSSNNILSLHEDRSGRLWIGTLDAGLDRLDPGREAFQHFRQEDGLSDDGITSILEDESGMLWLGTFNGGLNRLDPNTEEFQRYEQEPGNPNSLSSSRVYSLAGSTQGVLWVGTQEGLNRLEVAGGTFTHYSTRDGLPGNTICGILEGERGELWISTTNGLARDLHDSVTQLLYSLTLLAEAGLRMIEAGDLAESRENQKRLNEIAQQALQEMRLMVYELRPPALEKIGLAGALERRLEAVERRAGVSARLIVEGDAGLPPQVEEELYHLAQEALNNALKHAGQYAVTVRLRLEDGCANLGVKDDGRGFDPAAASRGGGLGLTSMRERAEKIGGRLLIESSPGAGTRVLFSNFSQAQIPGQTSFSK